jgi:hypothetical protein
VSVAFQKIEGVEKVEVSLNQGTATIFFKPGNKVSIDRIHELVRKNGFTAKEARVRARGKLVQRDGKPAFQITGSSDVFLLDGAPPKMAQEATVAGILSPDRTLSVE